MRQDHVYPIHKDFNPLPSCEGRPSGCVWLYTISDFNPLPSCEGRRAAKIGKKVAQTISIHSPHTRGDCPSPCRPSRRTYFNPLPSREGRRRYLYYAASGGDFNPLPSCEGRRGAGRGHGRRTRHFNPLPSCEGRQ